MVEGSEFRMFWKSTGTSGSTEVPEEGYVGKKSSLLQKFLEMSVTKPSYLEFLLGD